MLATPDRQEADERNLHAGKRAERIPRTVANIETRAVTTHADQYECVQGKQVGDEDVTAPCRHHVSVEKRSQCAPEDGSVLDCLDPEIEGEDQQKDGNGLVVITSSHRTGNVAGSDAHKGRGKETGGGRGNHFIR